MTGAEIIEDAKLMGDVPVETYPTIVKTLQARIAEDIATNQGRSRFIRTGIGTYFLKRLVSVRTVFGRVALRPQRKGRSKPLHQARLLTVPREALADILAAQDMTQKSEMVATVGRYKSAASLEPNDAPIITGTRLEFRSHWLEFEVGQHSYFPSLCGRRTGMVRRFVDEYDFDFFHTEPLGAVPSSARAVWPLLQTGRPSRQPPHFDKIESLIELLDIRADSETSCLCVLGRATLDSLFDHVPKIVRRLEFRQPEWIASDTEDDSALQKTDRRFDSLYQEMLRSK